MEEFMGGLEAKPAAAAAPQAGKELIDNINRISGRVRSFERSISDFRDMLRFFEERTNNMIKNILEKQKALELANHDLVDKLEKTHMDVTLIIKELQLTAKREDVEVIRRVMEIIKPTRFITEERAERLISTILEEKGLISSTIEDSEEKI